MTTVIKVSYELMEDAYYSIVGERPYPITMFVHRVTFREIRLSYGMDQYPLIISPITGRGGIRYNDGFIERRKWMPYGWMMFHQLGINLGEARIVQ